MLRKTTMSLTSASHSIFMSIGNISFLFILVVIEVALLLAGNSFFPGWDQTYGQLILVYIAMTVIFIVWAKRRTENIIGQPVNRSLFWFFIFFVVTWGVLTLLIYVGLLSPAEGFDTSVLLQTILVQICVVSLSEELMFRGAMMDELSRGPRITWFAVVVQAAVFAVYHSWAYQIVWYDLSWESLNLGGIVIAFIMGVILGVIAKNREWGLAGSIAVHSCYNLVVLGALVLPNLSL